MSRSMVQRKRNRNRKKGHQEWVRADANKKDGANNEDASKKDGDNNEVSATKDAGTSNQFAALAEIEEDTHGNEVVEVLNIETTVRVVTDSPSVDDTNLPLVCASPMIMGATSSQVDARQEKEMEPLRSTPVSTYLNEQVEKEAIVVQAMNGIVLDSYSSSTTREESSSASSEAANIVLNETNSILRLVNWADLANDEDNSEDGDEPCQAQKKRGSKPKGKVVDSTPRPPRARNIPARYK